MNQLSHTRHLAIVICIARDHTDNYHNTDTIRMGATLRSAKTVKIIMIIINTTLTHVQLFLTTINI